MHKPVLAQLTLFLQAASYCKNQVLLLKCTPGLAVRGLKRKKNSRSSSLLDTCTRTPSPSVVNKCTIPEEAVQGTAAGRLQPRSSASSNQSDLEGTETAYCRCNSLRRWCECGSDAHSRFGPCRRGRRSLAGSGSPSPGSSVAPQHP